MTVSTEDVRAFLVAWRERMADPDRVVLDPDHLYEDADGNEIGFREDVVGGEPPRACMLGHRLLLAPEDNWGSVGRPTVGYRAETLVLAQAPARRGVRICNCTQLLDRAGREGAVAVMDAAIAALGGGA